MRFLSDVPKEDLCGKRVLVRAGLDVPEVDGKVGGSFRLERAIPTISFLRDAGAKVILISHIGREPHESLEDVARTLGQWVPIAFVPDLLGEQAHSAIGEMEQGDVLLLENLRSDAREVENDPEFARELAALGDVYVNDAFSVCHRAHTSVSALPKLLPHYAGLELESELAHLSQALTPPAKALCIIGGAKFETKEPLIRKFLSKYEYVYVSGALANDVYAARGISVGASKVSGAQPSSDVLSCSNLLVPVDVTVIREDGMVEECMPEDIGEGDRIVDMGSRSLADLENRVAQASLVLWNGPTGIYEEGFLDMSTALARAIAGSGAVSLVGGGDTVTAIENANALEQFTFVSTGGGAMLDFLEDGTLPGIEALA